MQIIREAVMLFAMNSLVKVLLLSVVLDTFLGVLRACKEGKLNSAFGIDGAIRKVAMITCIAALMLTDVIVHINMLAFVPDEALKVVGLEKVGLCEFFALLFVVYECISIMKNLYLCGVPVPLKIKNWLEKVLSELTNELD